MSRTLPILALVLGQACVRPTLAPDETAPPEGLPPDDSGPRGDTSSVPDTEWIEGWGAPDDGEIEQVFAADCLPSIEITLSQDAITELSRQPFEYQVGEIRWTGCGQDQPLDYQDVGVRLKGRASYQPISGKPSFKIKLDEYVPGQRLHGLRRLTLNNMIQDASMVRERLGYLVFAAAGSPAPLCNHAKVYLNGDYYGLYANVQTLDDEFVEARYAPAPGNLYDTSNDVYCVDFLPEMEHYFELETNQDQADRSDLEAVIAAVNVPSEQFLDRAEAVLDLDAFLGVGAVQAVIADWDGYFGGRNNYKAYHELERDRFILLPWGIDQSFGMRDGRFTDLTYAIDGSSSQRDNGLVFQRCKELASCAHDYESRVEGALAAWDSLRLQDQLDTILEQIGDAAMQDNRRPYTQAEMNDAVTDLRRFLEQRGDIVRGQLE